MTIRFSRARPTLPYPTYLPYLGAVSQAALLSSRLSILPAPGQTSTFHHQKVLSLRPPPLSMHCVFTLFLVHGVLGRLFMVLMIFLFFSLCFFYFRDQRYFSLDCRHAAMDDMNP